MMLVQFLVTIGINLTLAQYHRNNSDFDDFDYDGEYDYDYDVIDDEGDVTVENSRCHLLNVDASDAERYEMGCLSENFRNFRDARSILRDVLCKDNPNWCQDRPDRILHLLVTNYGCNCYPENKMEKPKQKYRIPGSNGKPVDELDSICSILARRQRCLISDNINCSYHRDYEYVWNINRKLVKCTKGSKCEKQLCRMDREFAVLVYNMLEREGKTPQEFIEQNQTFKDMYDDPTRCVVKDLALESYECCGHKMSRVSYNPISHKCCDNSVVAKNSVNEVTFC